MNQDTNNMNQNNMQGNNVVPDNQPLNTKQNINNLYSQQVNTNFDSVNQPKFEQNSFNNNQQPSTIYQQQNNQNSNYNVNNQINNKPKKSNIGLIIGIIAGVFVLGVIGLIFLIIILTNIKAKIDTTIETNETIETNTFYGNGFTVEYSSDWTKTSLKTSSGYEEALAYLNDEAYLLPLGISALSDFENQYNVDFETSNGKKQLYNQFYTYWNNSSTKLYDGSDGFSELTDDIYYATMDYGTSATNIKGKMYLLIKEENNVIISFMSNISEDFDENSERILNILKTIDITKKYADTDDEIANKLDSLSAWNKYSSLRQGTLATKKDINGGWRILSNSETYWVFKNGEFWWYKSLNNLNDNYWYGKTKILTGKEGLKAVGLEETKVDSIIANSAGTVTSNNIYTIIFTPSKIIVDGVDKSSTNITGEDWHMVWIIVDHGKDGLEAQVLNVKTSETSYYVKIKD